MVDKILGLREKGDKLRTLEDLGKQTKLLKKAQGYVTF
jgi:hypothetical protein